MRRLALGLGLIAAMAGCVDNTAPGNDREAEVEPPAPAAELASAGAAIAGISPGLLKPETMTDADVGVVGAVAAECRFRMTRVGFPTFLYPADGSGDGVIKLNGKLVRLGGDGSGTYAGAGIQVTIRPLGEPDGDGLFPAGMVLRLPGAPHELGFHGFAGC